MDQLYHHGILGMKWGIRRYQNPDGSLTKAGHKRYSSVDTVQSKKTGEQLHISKRRSRIKNDPESDFDIITGGKKVGNLFLEKQGSNLYINWIDIKKSERGKGYANSIMDYVVNYAQKNNYKSLTLEVPETSPDARHIYEKHGFQVDKSSKSSTEDDIWGGLTAMKRKIR